MFEPVRDIYTVLCLTFHVLLVLLHYLVIFAMLPRYA